MRTRLVLAVALSASACVKTTQVPVRACVLQGADLGAEPDQVTGQDGQGTAAVAAAPAQARITGLLDAAMMAVWTPRATITFPLAARVGGPSHIPIVALTYSNPEGRTAGTIRMAGLKNELADAITLCRAAWAPYDDGVVVVWARDLVTDNGRAPAPDHGATRGLGAAVPRSRFDAVCADPSGVTADELAAVGVVVAEPSRFGPRGRSSDPVLVLAHELGHALLLGHGDGADGDGDGRWDDICDPDEDPEAQPFTVMTQGVDADGLTPGQIAWARAVAARYHGAIVPASPPP